MNRIRIFLFISALVLTISCQHEAPTPEPYSSQTAAPVQAQMPKLAADRLSAIPSSIDIIENNFNAIQKTKNPNREAVDAIQIQINEVQSQLTTLQNELQQYQTRIDVIQNALQEINAPVPPTIEDVAPKPPLENLELVDTSAWPQPLSDEQRQLMSQIRWDEKPEVLYAVDDINIGQHYLVSDEKHPELFKESITDLKGTYIGVGTDQGYLYIGWQKPEYAILIDYDPMVVELHQFILAFMEICDTSRCLYRYFSDEEKGLSWLKSEAGTAAGFNTEHMLHRYTRLRKSVLKSLSRLKESSETTMMNDRETYEYIRNLSTGGRLVTSRTNLLGAKSMKSIADSLNKLNAKVTVLYLSNAEQYWDYPPEFKENMLSLPYDDKAIVMRTFASYPQNGDYRYSIQPANIFKSWMERKRCKTVKQMLRKIPHIHEGEFPFVVDDIMPPRNGK